MGGMFAWQMESILVDLIELKVYDFLLMRGIAQSGSAPALGAGCRGFESLYPDDCLYACFAWRGIRVMRP